MLRNCPDLMTVKDIQNALNISRTTAYKLVESGELPTLRIGRIYRVPKPYLLSYIKKTLEIPPHTILAYHVK